MASIEKDYAVENKITGVHLDLKGLMFRPEYISALFADLDALGINTVLVEYEDIFPFNEIDIAWDKSVVWTKSTLNHFLSEARKHKIEIIPLQQCLSHLEYAFRWKKYRHMAEDPSTPRTLCLQSPDGRALVRKMLRQVIEAHPESRFIHIGMDEAVGLATCDKCSGKGSVLSAFLGYLDELIDFVHGLGKEPIIWSDMLEDNLQPELIEPFAGRVTLCVWDYSTGGDKTHLARINGFRISREWLDKGKDELPYIWGNYGYVEDLPRDILALVEPFRQGKWFKSLFQADLFTQMGFKVIGAGASRMSGDGQMLPDYGRVYNNLDTWSRALERNNQLGLIATSWARASSFYKPNLPFDLTWPGIGRLARSMGHAPEPFWQGLSWDEIDHIAANVARYRTTGNFESELFSELKSAGEMVQNHAFEWRSLMLLAEVYRWQRHCADASHDMEFFLCAPRMVTEWWDKELLRLESLLGEGGALKERTISHFSERYYGLAFDEWINALFAPSINHLLACITGGKEKREATRHLFNGTDAHGE